MTPSFITPTVPLDMLHAATDALGGKIEVGGYVRSFDFAMTMDDGRIGRCEPTGEYAAYVVGLVEAIGDDVVEGCARYRIRPLARRFGEEVTFYPGDTGERIYPPVNGTPSLFGDCCAGVFAHKPGTIQ